MYTIWFSIIYCILYDIYILPYYVPEYYDKVPGSYLKYGLGHKIKLHRTYMIAQKVHQTKFN